MELNHIDILQVLMRLSIDLMYEGYRLDDTLKMDDLDNQLVIEMDNKLNRRPKNSNMSEVFSIV